MILRRVIAGFNAAIAEGLAQWQRDRDAGQQPPPYFFRVPGSDTPPAKTWDALLQMRLGELMDPALVFELGFYYSERAGVGDKYLRYVTFVESEILPRLYEDPAVFYVTDGSRLKPQYAANMDRLRDWSRESDANMEWAICLDEKLNTPTVAGERCMPGLDLSGSGPDAVLNGAER